MKILMINKFLHPNGGSETYIFKLGNYLEKKGHDVQYFGMEHEGRCVGNNVNSYTSDMDFHGGFLITKLTYPFKTIYSVEARKKIQLVLNDFKPDVCHINNFNFQLTPSIILEIRKFEKKNKKKVRIVFTAHDSQLVCPNHLMQNPITGKPCTECLGGHYLSCIRGRCIHKSMAKSIIGAIEALYWNTRKTYSEINTIISPSNFLAEKLRTNPILKEKIIVIHNFIDSINIKAQETKSNYVLFFGRYSYEKGIGTLLKVIDELPDVQFVFAGDGPLVEEVNKRENIINKGFLSGIELQQTIASAQFAVIPSECFENCPFTVMESQICGTPVIGADIGGIPELIEVGKTGELFESGNGEALKSKIKKLWLNRNLTEQYSQNCKKVQFDTIDLYYEKVIEIYG